MLPGYVGELPVHEPTFDDLRARLPECVGYPPWSHAVVDDHIADNAATCKSSFLVTLTAAKKMSSLDGPLGPHFQFITYYVGPFANVFCLWPLTWTTAPGPNRFGFLPKAEFAGNPGLNDMRPSYPKMQFRYRDIDGNVVNPPEFGPL